MKFFFFNAYFKCFRCWLEVSTQSPNSVQSKHTGFKDGTHCIFWQRNTPRYWMKSCIFCELIKKEIGDHRIFNTWCGDPGKVCHCYFWWWACWLFCCWAFYWKWCMEKKNIDLIAFFKGSSTWCRPWDHRKGKPVSGHPGCRRYLAERFQLSTAGNIQMSHNSSGLSQLEKLHPGKLKNSRGRGTFCAVDCRLFNFHEISWRTWWQEIIWRWS